MDELKKDKERLKEMLEDIIFVFRLAHPFQRAVLVTLVYAFILSIWHFIVLSGMTVVSFVRYIF